MPSLFVQVTVVPTGTVIACGPKTKLSIFTATFAAEGWSLAATRDESREQQQHRNHHRHYHACNPHILLRHLSFSFLDVIFLLEP
jgi:hypothetical protein